MNNTMLISASRQIALARELDIVANNVANIGTTGFKRRTANFAEHLMPGARADSLSGSDKRLSFVRANGDTLDIGGGAVEMTGNPLDVAMRGDSFLAVQTPQGERYTRNGSMALGPDGTLMTMDGHTVLTDGGPLSFSVQDGPVSIASDGTVSTAQGTRGRLRIVRFANPHALTNIGANLYAADQPAAPLGNATRLTTGALEKSNVSAVTETTRLVEISRAYTNIAQMMQRNDEMRRSAITRLADTN